MSRTRFGEAALGDPSFVTVFGRGRSPRLDTADRLLAFMGLEPIGPGFRREVDAFLAVTGAKSSELGREVSGNPSFVGWLRRGGSPRLATVDKARAWMKRAASAEEVRAIRAMASGDGEISQDIFKGDYDMGDDTWQYMGTRELASFLGLSPHAGPLQGERRRSEVSQVRQPGALRPRRCRGVGGGTPVQLDYRRGQSGREDGVMGGLTIPRLKRYRQAIYRIAGRGEHERPARDTTLMTVGRLFACPCAGLPIRFARSGYFALLLAMLAGCGLAEVEHARMETGDVARQVSALRGSELRTPQAGPRLSTVRLIERRPYVGLTRIEPDPRAGLPPRFRRVDAVTLPLSGIGAAAVLAGRIEAATGLAVRFTGSPHRASETTGGDPPLHLLSEAGRDGLSPDGGIWTGPLDALLDAWTEPAGYEWRYEADRQAIEIVRRRSVVFHIHALAGTQRYTVSSSTQDSAAGGDGGGNLTSQTISTETDYDPWPEIEGQLKELLDPGTRLSVAPSSASVTVSGTPHDIARARAYLGYLNREVLRPVTLSVHVYSVRVEREADYDLGLSFSIARLLGEALRVSVGSNAVALIKPSPGGESGDTLSATVKALNSAGAVSRVLSADIPSLNGKPAQFFELFQEAYLRELRTTAGEGIAQTELTPGTVSSGFAVSYLPRITGPGEVLVRLFASLRDRPSFTAFTTNNQTIQLPAYASRAIQVTQKIGRGETLMVTGFSDRSAAAGRSGTFDADLPLPGGGRKASTARIEQVLLVTADIGAPLGIAEVRGMAF